MRRVQSQKMRHHLRPFLPAIAVNKAFLPETARRLGDPLFTSRFYVVDADERLIAYVRGLQDAEEEACRNLYAGGR